ncbi:MAG: hypothetical protein NW220_22265 [Leptolyngbyaceae cyanobacterium bins.349]|nr:hypothetical protein [Leptolyngbyaceae cyanobacterium bins.349]
MKRNQGWLWSVGILVLLVVVASPMLPSRLTAIAPASVQAQSPTPRSTPTAPNAPLSPASPAPSPGPTVFPAVPVTPSALPTPPAPPASTAPPAELGSTYADPSGRFKVGVLKNYKVSPLAGSVLIESPDGTVAYTVVAQSQPLGNPIGIIPGYDNTESLAKIATTVFQRGEGFQPALARSESGGGAVMDWTGALTIGGISQPMRGVILVRPTLQNILLLLIAATQTGEAQVPGALSALAKSLEPLQ